MPVIQLHDQHHQLKPGSTRLGSGPDVDVRVSEDASLGVQAVLDLGAGDQVVIRRIRDGVIVKVNGVALGAEPTPLIHGDKVEIAGTELQFSDDKKGGATQYVSATEIAAMAAKRSGPARATAATGGRLVSLVDGKEYPIPDSGVTFGRDASNEVVVAQNEVSRRHASIGPGEGGYILTDLSTNGVFVNGDRIEQTKLLARSDVIRVGAEEFRFYADVAPAPAASATASTPVVAAPPPPPPPPVPRPAPPPLSQEPPTIPTRQPMATPPLVAAAAAAAAASAAADARPVLATLEFISDGPDKGRRVDILSALTNIGRGTHNDVVVAHDSVSDAHAKLLHRDGDWYLLDVGSTNGTYVGGTRISTERRLDGSPDIRFGGMKMRFHPAESAAAPATGTRRVSALTPPHSNQSAPGGKTSRVPVWAWIVIALVVVAGAVYFLKG